MNQASRMCKYELTIMLTQHKILLNHIRCHAGQQELQSPVRKQTEIIKSATATNSTQQELEEKPCQGQSLKRPSIFIKRKSHKKTINGLGKSILT